MALNQTQRDHAIKMVTERINEKKKIIEIPYRNPNDFAQDWLKTNKRKITPAELFPKEVHEYRRYDGAIYQPSFDSISPHKLFPGLIKAWDVYCESHAQENVKRTASLVKLEEKLIGEIMFGQDYAVIEAAFAAIDSIA